ncbi:MAG: hypothetical protein AAFR22_16320 [Chloroflexota bacterium]
MTRLLSTMRLDVTLQARNKLYHISIGLALLIAVAMRSFFPQDMLGAAIPAFVLMAIGGTTFMFVAGMIIFEKNENTLDGIIVTPLRVREYLFSKTVTLTLLATLETSVIILLSFGFGFNGLLVYTGMVLLGAMMVLMGIIPVVRYDTVTDFFLPAGIIGVITQLPIFLLANLGAGLDALWYAIPTAAPFVLMLGGFDGISTWQLIYGVGYSVLWIAGLSVWAKIAFDRHIILMGGS